VLLLALLGTIAALALAGAAAAAPIVALQDDRGPVVTDPAQRTKVLDQLAATGVKLTRVDVLWDRVAPTRPKNPSDPGDPAYDWSPYDAYLSGLAARGISAIVDFYETPPWATPSGDDNAAPRAADAAAFAAALARRYNGTFRFGGARLPEVRLIEIWNEPNIRQFFTPQCRRVSARGKYVYDAPREYAAILTASYRAIKRVNPDAVVIGGVAGPAGGDDCVSADSQVGTATFIAQLAREHPPIDAWSQHIYPIGGPLQAFFFPSWLTMPRLQRLVDKLRPGLPIYVTETGYHTSYNRYHRSFVSEAQQATYLVQTYQVAARYPRVQAVVWFNFVDNPFWTGGLLRANGTRKPSYAQFVRLASGQSALARPG